MNLLLPGIASAYLITFARIGTLIMLMPGIGEQTVSPRLRLAFALLTALVLFPTVRPLLGAMQNFGGYIGGALAPTVTGFIVGGTGHFSMAFITGAAIALVAALGYWTLIQDPIADEAPERPLAGALGAAR
ncbi:flagellar biosynthetic protein FliR [Methylobacterium organophilum]|nr:flagellar biosynthetic protein FliR [Methylobacterium organophilum]